MRRYPLGMANTALPLCPVLLVCESVEIDPRSHKPTITGSFEKILADKFPHTHPKLWIYCEFTSGHGRTPISIKLARLPADSPEEELIGQFDLELDFTDPNEPHQVPGELKNVPFTTPGTYRVYVDSNGSLIAQRRLLVHQRHKA